jgi:hypothetical protein
MSAIDEAYEKFKHLDKCLSDPEWCTSGEGAAIYAIAGELWRAVKEARNQPRPPCEECIYQSQSVEMSEEIIKAFTKGHIAGAKGENTRVIDKIIEFCEANKSGPFPFDGSTAQRIINFIEVMRIAQPEPTEREPE